MKQLDLWKVFGNAGLFANASSLAKLLKMFLIVGNLKETILKPETLNSLHHELILILTIEEDLALTNPHWIQYPQSAIPQKMHN